MLGLGLAIAPGELRWVWSRPSLVTRGLVSALVVVPVMAVAVVPLFGLPRWLEIGVVLMAISPGAPVALQRSLGAGAHRSFAPALQILVAGLAIVSLPISIALLNERYAGHAWVHPLAVARQVFVAQLFPLGLGQTVRRLWPDWAVWLQPRLARLGMALLVFASTLIVIAVAPALVDTGVRLALASALVSALALAAGHLLGGPEPGTRTAVAIGSAARNPGLALLVVTLNQAPLEAGAAVMTHLLISAVTIVPYAFWRLRARR
jgi:BASS family bile acid:Na+ symporter